MFVRPAADRKVRDPVTKRHLPESGKEVPPTAYWMRRVADGDVLVGARAEVVVQHDQIPDSLGSEE